ncbi:membrane protein insertion efficiency factor YidD [bacterium]|nr:membrane protein insertion efficiency factor YidD [bacterium]
MITKCAILAIKIYQSVFSPIFPASCRFYPTCSQYTIEALTKYGILKGILCSARRIIRCNPFNSGGYDPVK